MSSRTGARAWPGALVAAGLTGALLISGCAGSAGSPASSVTAAGPGAGESSPPPVTPTDRPPSPTAPSGVASPTGTAAPAPATTAARTAAARARARRLALDRLAGVRSTSVVWAGSGKLSVVPGRSPAPGRGRIYRIRVEVEAGLNVDRAAFARYVLATLNDERSWTENGRRRFARTDGAADLRVVLASPETSAAICQPLKTFGKLSCRRGDAAVLTMYRWTKAIAEYTGNHDGYRRYVVNHEVGHALGHGHEYCAGRGRVAPVMMQQTKGLQGCRPNPWPHP